MPCRRSVYKAAARAMEQIGKTGGKVSRLIVTMHEPKGEWKVTEGHLLKYVSSYGSSDNIGLRSVKQNVKDFLKPPSNRSICPAP